MERHVEENRSGSQKEIFQSQFALCAPEPYRLLTPALSSIGNVGEGVANFLYKDYGR